MFQAGEKLGQQRSEASINQAGEDHNISNIASVVRKIFLLDEFGQ